METGWDVAVFIRVVEERSFARAATSLGISRSYASRVIAGLEERLGARLIERTTRRVEPTPTGLAFFEAVQPLVEGLTEAEARVKEEAEEPHGTLRVALPLAFGLRWLVEPIVRFQEAHPRIRMVVDYEDRKVDLVGEGYDLVVRGATEMVESWSSRPLWRFRILPVASPAYLAAMGSPAHPRDLTRHRCVLYAGNVKPGVWGFFGPGGQVDVPVDGPLLLNTSPVVAEACLAGAGIALLPDFLVFDAVRDGRLRVVLPDWRGPEGQFWALRSSRRFAPARVRVFLDHLAGCLRTPPWSDPTPPVVA